VEKGVDMSALRRLWHTWKRVGQAIGDFIARVILVLFYFTIYLPFGLIVRFAWDPLRMKPVHRAQWLARTTTDHTLEDARRLG
jgi:hypothetical protein